MMMGSSIKWILALGIGVAGGWALRSLSDTPEGAGVKLLELGLKAKNRLSSWAAIERERLEDMLAEAQANNVGENGAASTAQQRQRRRGDARTARRESARSRAAKNNVPSLSS
jgi:hypothetical protein